MVIIRRLARGVAILAVALAAGHLVQTINSEQQLKTADASRPTQVVQLSAGPQTAPAPVPVTEPAPPLATDESKPAPVSPVPLPQAPAQMLAAATPDILLPEPAAPMAPILLPAEPPAPAAAATAPTLPAPEASPASAEACPVTLDLMPEPDAMLGLTLVAPCHPNERVVLRHAGLAVTAQTSATGSLFTSLPAMAMKAEVSVRFSDQSSADAEIQIPEMASLRRFGVQWMADDAFQLQALENGAAFGSAGHKSADNPGAGAVRVLGDAAVDSPMLAEVYTYPADPKATVEVIVEARVTEATCNRDLLGETITSVGGKAIVKDLTVATPPCDAVGDILMLKNLAPDQKIAVN